jgi:hypothetical protein
VYRMLDRCDNQLRHRPDEMGFVDALMDRTLISTTCSFMLCRGPSSLHATRYTAAHPADGDQMETAAGWVPCGAPSCGRMATKSRRFHPAGDVSRLGKVCRPDWHRFHLPFAEGPRSLSGKLEYAARI